MAKDKITMKLHGGTNLDRKLSSMQQRIATKFVNQSLSSASTKARNEVRKAAPKASKDTTGFKTSSRNVTTGQLKKSIASGLLKKVNVSRNSFLAGIWFKSVKGSGKMKGTANVDDGFFAKFVIDRHKPNAFGYRGGNDFLSRGQQKAAPAFIKTMGQKLGSKVKAYMQKELG